MTTLTDHLWRGKVTSERFWEKVLRGDACWRWLGAIDSDGYGTFQAWIDGRGRVMNAARYSFLLNGGRIPEGWTVDHLCRIRNCVNPAHLEAVTAIENTRRGTFFSLERNHHKNQTHCKRGHPFDEANTWWGRYGPAKVKLGRWCRACMRQREHASLERRKAQGIA